MTWQKTSKAWWLDKKPTIVEKATKEFKTLGVDAKISYTDYKWKIVFKSQDDMNLYKLLGEYGRLGKRIKMIVGKE